MRRIAAIVLSSLRICLARLRNPDLTGAPLAVVVTRHDGGPKDERALLGNTRLDEVSDEAWKHGVRPGQTVAQARAKSLSLRVRVVHEDEASLALASLAEALLAFGATTSILAERDALLVDVTGCAHLHAAHANDAVPGESALLAAIEGCVQALGYRCRVAIADGPEVAWAVAASSPRSRVLEPGRGPTILASLPVAILRLDEGTTSWLQKLGIRTLGELQRLPRASLGSRLGKAHARVFALLDNEDHAPLRRFEPREILEERVELEYGLEALEPLFFVLKTLCDRVSARLFGRCLCAARLDVELKLDRALVPEGREPFTLLSVPLPMPIHRTGELLAVLRARFEAQTTRELFPAPILAVTLRVPEPVVRTEKELSLFVAESRAERALAPLLAELTALLGPDSVGTLRLHNRWAPEERSRIVPVGTKHARRSSFVSSTTEPVRWLPEPLACRVVPASAPLVRLAQIEWWRGERSAEQVMVWIEGALAIVEIEGDGARIRGFVD